MLQKEDDAISIREVAKKSGYSIATVSRFFNSPDLVSPKASKKIKETIEELQYHPNRNVRTLFGNKSETIGLIVPSLVNPFFSELATLIGNLAQGNDIGLILCFTEDQKTKEEEAIKQLLEYRVDGIISIRPTCINVFKTIDLPIVTYESDFFDKSKLIVVNSDNYNGGKVAFKHLFSKKCKRFIHIRGPKSFKATNDRYRGFNDAAKKEGVKTEIINVDEDFYLQSVSQIDNIVSSFNFQNGDGVFVYNDIMAMFLIDKLSNFGFDLPSDIKIVSFDNSFMSQHYSPSLTTIEQSTKKISEICYSNLMKIVDERKITTQEVVIPVKLIERDST